MEDKVFKAALGGLLHNIGKFAQRAGEAASRTWDGEAEQDYKYQHALYSGDFVEKYVPSHWAGELSGPASHDRPRSGYNEVTALADQLSAGEPAGAAGSEAEQMVSVFCNLTLNQGHAAAAVAKRYLPLKPLAIREDVIFPGEVEPDPAGAYRKLWDEFIRAAQALKTAYSDPQTASPSAYLSGLVDLLQRYTWSIPAVYDQPEPDVSLYDHSRMTAALAACLVNLPQLPAAESDIPAALLVGGDISGVQRFIYTITSSGAAKSLRGRSFYLQLLTEVVARYILEQLGLPLTNLIYAGGGNFFLLAAAGKDQEDKLAGIAKDVSERLLTTHEGELHLILECAPVQAGQFKVGEFSTAWDNLHRALNQKKLKPLANLENAVLGQEIGRGMGVGGDEDHLCAICGREDDQTRPKESGGEVVRTCRLCESFEQLGNELVKATHLVMFHGEARTRQRVDRWWHGLELFGVNFWAINGDRPPQEERYLTHRPAEPRLVEIVTLKNRARYSREIAAELAQINAPRLDTFRLFAQLVPTGQDSSGQEYPLTFDELAELATAPDGAGTRWSGLKRWGVLRMDVDNLGALFSEGFKAGNGPQGQDMNKLSLSRLASLSFALRLFFEGWLPHLGRPDKAELSPAEQRMQDRLYVQYAGGDDLFVAGSWDALPEFALAIQESFKRYVCENPAVTLSGGAALATVKYPLYRAAKEAETAEGAAKKYRQAKNAFCFLGQVVGWEDFRPVMERAYQLAKWCGDGGPLSRALLQNLMAIHREYREGRDKAIAHKKWQPGQIYWGPWMYHLAYQMARRTEGRQVPQAIKEELRALETAMLEDRHNIETIGLAARWAQFLIRK